MGLAFENGFGPILKSLNESVIDVPIDQVKDGSSVLESLMTGLTDLSND